MDHGQGGYSHSCCGFGHSSDSHVHKSIEEIIDPNSPIGKMLALVAGEGVSQLRPVTQDINSNIFSPPVEKEPMKGELLVPGKTHTASYKSENFVKMLRQNGYDTDAILAALNDADGNARQQLRESIGEDRYTILQQEITWTKKEVTAEQLVKAGQIKLQPGEFYNDLMAALGVMEGGNRSISLRREDLSGPTGLPGPVGKPLVSPEIKIVGSKETLAEAIAGHIVPDMMKKLSDALDITDITQRMREQRRIADRFQKLMRYTAKPESINASAIACPHELAIYKWSQLNKAAEGLVTTGVAFANIDKATQLFMERESADKLNRDHQRQAQELNQKRAAIMERVIGEVGAIEELVNGLETRQLAQKLQAMAADILEAENGAPVKQQAQLDFVPGQKLGVPFEGSRMASDDSDMGLDYRRSVPTTAGGFSDDKFGAATRNGLTTDNPAVPAFMQGFLNARVETRAKVFPTEQARQDQAQVKEVQYDHSGPGVQSSEYPPNGGRLQVVTNAERERRAEFVTSITQRLEGGEAISESELLKAAELAKTLPTTFQLELARIVGIRMMGKAPFLQ